MLLDVRPDHLKIVQDILQRFVPDREVWAFGSRAKWLAKEYSDLDLCVLGETPLSFRTLGLLEEAFDESDLPYKVDVVDWATTSPSFRKVIEAGKVVIQKGNQSCKIDFEWKSTTLGQVCNSQGGAIQTGPFGSQLHTSDYKELGVPVVMPTNIGDGGLVEDGIARIGEADVERLSQHKLRLGDIVFSRRGDVTKNALISVREVGWLCGTGCLKVRLGDESIASAKFISHYLRQPDTKEWLIRHAVGATMPNLNTGILSAVPVHLPPLQTQLEIAAMLDALDDKITLLRETNTTLEAIAQALFKSWFVDFDPVRAKAEGCEPEGTTPEISAIFPSEFQDSELGEIPQGWTIRRLGDALELAYGKALKATDRSPGTVPVYGSGGITGYHNQHLVAGPSVIVGRKGTVGSLYWEDRPFFPIDTVFYVKPKVPPLTFCYYLLRTLGLDSMNTDAAVPGLNRDNAYRLTYVMPTDEVFRAFDNCVTSLREKIFASSEEVRNLSEIRDAFLPRLMSGKLRIPELQEAIEEAAV